MSFPLQLVLILSWANASAVCSNVLLPEPLNLGQGQDALRALKGDETKNYNSKSENGAKYRMFILRCEVETI